jgi:hypothetical protein
MNYVLQNYDPKELILFKPYFMLSYQKIDSVYPHIETYVYVGKNLHPEVHEDDRDHYYFQDAESFEKHGIFSELSEDIEHFTICLPFDSIASMENIDRLIKHLTFIGTQEKKRDDGK